MEEVDASAALNWRCSAELDWPPNEAWYSAAPGRYRDLRCISNTDLSVGFNIAADFGSKDAAADSAARLEERSPADSLEIAEKPLLTGDNEPCLACGMYVTRCTPLPVEVYYALVQRTHQTQDTSPVNASPTTSTPLERSRDRVRYALQQMTDI